MSGDIYNGENFASHTCFNRLDIPRKFIKDETGELLVDKPDFKHKFLKPLVIVSIQDTGYGVAGIKVFKKKPITTKKNKEHKKGKSPRRRQSTLRRQTTEKTLKGKQKIKRGTEETNDTKS